MQQPLLIRTRAFLEVTRALGIALALAATIALVFQPWPSPTPAAQPALAAATPSGGT